MSCRRRVQFLVYAGLLWQEWRAPLERVPTDLVSPFLSRVQFPWKYPELEGAWAGVSMIGWIFLCDRFADGLLQAVDSLQTL